MSAVVYGFITGTLGAIVVFLAFARLSGESRFSAPFGLISIGVTCAVLSHFVSPWTVPFVVLAYAGASAVQYFQEKKSVKTARNPESSSE